VYQHSTASIESRLYERIRGGEMLQQVFIVDIINFDLQVFIGTEQIVVELHAKY